MRFFLHWSSFQLQTSVLYISWLLMNINSTAFLPNCVFLIFLVASISFFMTLPGSWHWVSFVFCEVKVNNSAVLKRAGHRRHVDSTSWQLLLQHVSTSQSTYFALQFSKRQDHGKTTRKRPFWIFSPFFNVAINVYKVLNCKKRWENKINFMSKCHDKFICFHDETASSLFLKAFTGVEDNY